MNKTHIKTAVEQWLDNVVIGLELCPFAKQPRQNNQIDIHISSADSVEALMMELVDQLTLLEKTSAKDTETTVMVVPELLSDFDDYLDCLYLAEELIVSQGWEGIFQIASFHPDYQFEGTEPSDAENLTNRSPYPIFHLLREERLAVAIESYGDTGQIPERNKNRMKNLSREERRRLFNDLTAKG